MAAAAGPGPLQLRGSAARLFSVLRLAPDASLPPFATAHSFASFALCSATRSRRELSIVVATEHVPSYMPMAPGDDAVRREDGWAALHIEPAAGAAASIPFDAVGVLLALLRPLAAAKVGIFALSTFDTDHLLVKATDLDTACAALRAAGHSVALDDDVA